jgi:hypothetical protein
MSWKILDMQHKTSDGFVIEVSSCYEVQDGLGYARKVFLQEFEETAGPEFIPYENLTEETVIGWVKDKLGPDAVNETESTIAAEALAKKQELETPVTEGGKPWDKDEFDPTKDQGGLTPS